MEIHQVRYFVAVAKILNFTRAAESCNVTQPALTKAIQKLEYELGGDLIFRERQLTQLTDLGKLVLPILEKLLAAADTVRVRAREFKQKALAPLRIGLSPCLSATLVMDLITEVSKDVPGLQLELVETLADDLSKPLLDGDLSVAFSSGSAQLPDRIDQWLLFQEPFVLQLSPAHPLARGSEVSMDQLLGEVWIERTGCNALTRLWSHEAFGATEPHILHRGRQESHLQEMVAAGLGLLLAAQHAPCGKDVVVRPIKGQPLSHHVHMLTIAGRRYTPALEALIKIAQAIDWVGQTARTERPLATSDFDLHGFELAMVANHGGSAAA